jgi:hypothetical protein
MIERVISGGQTGADQAAWRAAKAAGIATGGRMPRGFATEDGPRPEFAELYGARESGSPSYAYRTRMNVMDSDATIIFDTGKNNSLESKSKGTQLAVRTAMERDKPSVVIVVELQVPSVLKRWEAMARWLIGKDVRVLNVAGNRESSAPGIGAWVEAYLAEVFRLLQRRPSP